MATLQEPIVSRLANLCLRAVRYLLYPSFVTFNCLMSLYYPTFEEQEDQSSTHLLLKQVLLTLPFAAIFILLIPAITVLLPIRCLLVSIRRPFRYSERHNERTSLLDEAAQRAIAAGEYKFGVGSANICLMPELLSRMNHLSDVDYRSTSIGQRIKEDQFASHQMLLPCNGSSSYLPSCSGHCNGKTEKDVGGVASSFPPLDILCVQEAWSSYHNKVLIDELHQTFPYIVHDVGVHAYNVNRFVLNSGHLVASRHPIEAIDFKPYKHFVDHGKIISMGVTCIKLQLGSTTDKGKNVAYVFNTHLQSYQGEHEIILSQLDEFLEYSGMFIKKNSNEGDKTAFCIVCGDFNMDNLSPADQANTRHRIFELFEDFPRVKPGLDKPWAIGTELRQDRMMDSAVSTPELLKQATEDKALRQCYLLDGDIKEHTKNALVYTPVKMDDQGNIKVVPGGGGRRIDYILFDKQYPLEVKSYHFVTRLATLTDHIPVAMEFTCPNLL